MPTKYSRRRADTARRRLLVAGGIMAVLIVAAGVAKGGRGDARTGQGAAYCGTPGPGLHIDRRNSGKR